MKIIIEGSAEELREYRDLIGNEQAVKWAKFGRRHNEFKKGDIVRFNKDTGAEGFRKGSIVEIETEVVGKDFEFGNGYSGYTDWIELVVPVEARVDR